MAGGAVYPQPGSGQGGPEAGGDQSRYDPEIYRF
jgi:hypothetical protein